MKESSKNVTTVYFLEPNGDVDEAQVVTETLKRSNPWLGILRAKVRIPANQPLPAGALAVMQFATVATPFQATFANMHGHSHNPAATHLLFQADTQIDGFAYADTVRWGMQQKGKVFGPVTLILDGAPTTRKRMWRFTSTHKLGEMDDWIAANHPDLFWMQPGTRKREFFLVAHEHFPPKHARRDEYLNAVLMFKLLFG